MTFISLACAIILSTIHLFGTKLTFLRVIPRSRWLSFGSGISVAYVFIHLLPELQVWQEEFLKNYSGNFFSNHLYVVALLGLIIFYGLEEKIKSSSNKEKEETSGEFWIHIISFMIYNGIIGYLLVHRDEESVTSLIVFAIAMAFHFIVNDYGLWYHHKDLYSKKGKWLATGGILLGWMAGFFTDIPETAVSILFAFVAGGILLNVLKEEMPDERESKFSAFLVGALLYSILLVASEYFISNDI